MPVPLLLQTQSAHFKVLKKMLNLIFKKPRFFEQMTKNITTQFYLFFNKSRNTYQFLNFGNNWKQRLQVSMVFNKCDYSQQKLHS